MSNSNVLLRMLEPTVRPGGLAFVAKPRVGPIETQSFDQVLESARQLNEASDSSEGNGVSRVGDVFGDGLGLLNVEPGIGNAMGMEQGEAERLGEGLNGDLNVGLSEESGLGVGANGINPAATLQIMVDQLSQVDRIENAALRQMVAGAVKPSV
jgi:hypothetical protein